MPGTAIAPGQQAGSGSHIVRSLAVGDVQGDAQTNASTLAKQSQEDRYQAGMQRIIDFGLGKQGSAASTTANVASIEAGNEATNTALHNYAKRQSFERGSEVVGAALGAGLQGAAVAGPWGGKAVTGSGAVSNAIAPSDYKSLGIGL